MGEIIAIWGTSLLLVKNSRYLPLLVQNYCDSWKISAISLSRPPEQSLSLSRPSWSVCWQSSPGQSGLPGGTGGENEGVAMNSSDQGQDHNPCFFHRHRHCHHHHLHLMSQQELFIVTQCSLQKHKQLNLTESYQILLNLSKIILLNLTKSYQILPNLTESYWFLLNLTESYGILPNLNTESYWILPADKKETEAQAVQDRISGRPCEAGIDNQLLY